MNERQAPIVDAYTHCGTNKYLPIENVADTMNLAGVSRAILAQHLGEFDNSYIRDIVASAPERYAGVCLVDHESSGVQATLEELAASGTCQGIRWPIAPDIDNLDQVSLTLDLGLIVVAYFPDSMATCVDALDALTQRHPTGQIVISHLGNPSEDDDEPLTSFRQAGVLDVLTCESLFVQLSGMEMTTEYPHDALYDLVGTLFETIGPHRMTWGSNYPVVGTAEDYLAELQLLLDGRLPIPTDAIPAVAGGNALTLWFSS